jgi:uncharacterized integral membrane protein (TIGR02327 family)
MEGATLLGIDALIYIFLSLASIAFSWWALWGVRLEMFVRSGKVLQAKTLMILLSISLGHQLTRFLTDYLGWAKMVGSLFR